MKHRIPVGACLRATGCIETMMVFATTGRAQARSYNMPRSRGERRRGRPLARLDGGEGSGRKRPRSGAGQDGRRPSQETPPAPRARRGASHKTLSRVSGSSFPEGHRRPERQGPPPSPRAPPRLTRRCEAGRRASPAERNITRAGFLRSATSPMRSALTPSVGKPLFNWQRHVSNGRAQARSYRGS